MKAIPTIYGVVVKGTVIPSVAKHYCRSFGIPFGEGDSVYGRMKFIPKKGYVRAEEAKAGGTFMAVILPVACFCTEEEIATGCVIHYHVQYKERV